MVLKSLYEFAHNEQTINFQNHNNTWLKGASVEESIKGCMVEEIRMTEVCGSG